MPEQDDRVKELERARERCLLQIGRLREQMRADIGRGVSGDEDSADAAADIYERTRVISLIASQETKLRALDHAIAAVRAGTYGVCEMCGQPIPEERLMVVPETTLCVRCASRMEQGMRQDRHRDQDTERKRGQRRIDDD